MCVCVCEVFPQVFCTYLFGLSYFFLLIYSSSLSSSYCNSLSVIYMVQICFPNLWFMFIFAMISYDKEKLIVLICLYCFPYDLPFSILRNSSLSFSQKDILPHDILKFFIVSHYTFKSLKHLKLILQFLSFFLSCVTVFRTDYCKAHTFSLSIHPISHMQKPVCGLSILPCQFSNACLYQCHTLLVAMT